MTHPVALPVLLALAGTASASTTAFTPLVQLLEQGAVTVNAEGLGDHQGECVRVTVSNRTARPIRTSIPPGWVFVSVTPEVQDLLVVREEVLAVAGGTATTVVCRAFCCEASGNGPQVGERYRTGHQAPEKLTAVALAIAQGDRSDEQAQHAVWVLSDGHSIASMGAMDSSAADTLRMVVSRLSGQPPPRYSLRYVDEEGRVCSGRPEAINRAMPYTVPSGTVFTAVVLDGRGRVVQVLYDRVLLGPGHHVVPMQVAVLGWPPGTYAIHAYSPDRAGVHRMPFTL